MQEKSIISVEDDFDAPEEDFTDFVPVAFARSVEDAEQYRELLNDHDIPALVASQEELDENKARQPDGQSAITHGVPVLVPDVLLDEASEIIADREDADEFGNNDDDLAEEKDDDDIGLTEKDFDQEGDDLLFGDDEPE